MAHRGFALRPGTPARDRIQYHVAVNVETRCWEWLGAVDKSKGYARITWQGRCAFAHRVAYEAFVGPIPTGLELDHLCRNRRCVNPEHLEPVSPQVNVLRGESPGAKAQRRTHCIHGHEYAIHGFMYRGRRKCRQCNIDYLRTYSAERRRARESQWIARGMAERGDVA